MTKLRAPLSFSMAITRIAGLIGWEEAARIVTRAERTVRLWSESDIGGTPTLAQALALDMAYRAAGGQGAPILESYALQVEVALTDALACQLALADAIASVATESADAIASSIAVTRPGISPTLVHHAIAETEQASGALTRLVGRLKSFLPGNAAVQAMSGDMK